MRLTTSLRATAAVLATSVLLATGPATATARQADPSPADAATEGQACRAAPGGAARTTRGPDHRRVTSSEQRAIEARTARLLAQRTQAAVVPDQEVPVYVHVMAGADGEGDVSRRVVRRQVRVLNGTFGRSGFTFDLAGVDRTYDDRYHRDRRSREYRAQTRRGGAGALNIWLVDFVYLGVATFPWDQAGSPRTDGVRVDGGTLPGGDLEDYDQGKTATHEVGHWLGLFHTFQGGCTRRNDAVSDTPAQASESRGCPVGRDSCSRPGVDPVHNYMDYSDDACYERFSPGQRDRMRAMFAAYRA